MDETCLKSNARIVPRCSTKRLRIRLLAAAVLSYSKEVLGICMECMQ